MKNYMKFALVAACVLGLGFTSCSDDDDVIKTALKEPVASNAAATVSSLTFQWDKVEHATQYGYELTDPAGNVVMTDVTKKTAVTFTGLRPATTYTLGVWAYSKLYGDMESSKVATLTATTASTQQLAAPQLSATVAAGVASVTWEPVPGATSYTYSYMAPDKESGEDVEVTGETSENHLEISGLPIDRTYKVSVYATSSDEVYTPSEVVSVSFTMSHSEAWTVQGTYTSAHLGKSFPVTMIAYDDNSYTLMAWYGVDYYNFDFSVGSDGIVTPNGSYARTADGDYIIPTGVNEMREVYISTGSNPSTFTGNERSGQITIRTCNYDNGTDTFVWVPARQEMWRAEGTYHSAVTGQDYAETLIAYDDNTYALEPWYGVTGFNLEFKADPSNHGSIDEIMNAEGYYDNGYWANTGLGGDYYGMYIWPGYDASYEDYCSYISGGRLSGEVRLYVYAAGVAGADWCVDSFTWGNSASSITIDDLVGEYKYVTKGQEYVTDYTNWYDFDYDGSYTVSKSESDPNSLVFDNFYWTGYPLTGKVDLEKLTITFQPQTAGYYIFASSEGENLPMVAKIDPANLTITFDGWNMWYDGYYYFRNTLAVFTKL